MIDQTCPLSVQSNEKVDQTEEQEAGKKAQIENQNGREKLIRLMQKRKWQGQQLQIPLEKLPIVSNWIMTRTHNCTFPTKYCGWSFCSQTCNDFNQWPTKKEARDRQEEDMERSRRRNYVNETP